MAKKKATSKRSAPSGEKTTSFKPEHYNTVSRMAELASIILTDCQFRVAPEFFKKDDSKGPAPKFSYGSKVVAPNYDAEEGLAGVYYVWHLNVMQGRRKVIKLRATFYILYENLKELDDAAVEAFVTRVGKFATYPYFRALTSQLSWGSQTDLPVLPVISVTR